MDRRPKDQLAVAIELLETLQQCQAEAIAARVYQPLLDEIKRLEKRVEALEVVNGQQKTNG